MMDGVGVTTMGESTWTVKLGEREIGPLTKDELRQWASQGRISPDSSVRQFDGDVWQTAGSVPFLFESQPMNQNSPVETVVSDAPSSLYRLPHKKSGHGAQHRFRHLAAIVGGLCAVGLAMAAFVALDRPGTPEPATNPFEQITDSMPRQQVESILGAGTRIDGRIEHIGTSNVKIEILEWRPTDGHQRIRIEFADDKMISKTIDEI